MFVRKHCREGRQEFRVFADVESTIQNFDARGGALTMGINTAVWMWVYKSEILLTNV